MEKRSDHYFHQLYSNDKLTNMTFGSSGSSLAKTLVWSPGCNILVIICHNSQEHFPNSLVCPQENYIVLLFAPIHQTNWPKVKVVKLNSFLIYLWWIFHLDPRKSNCYCQFLTSLKATMHTSMKSYLITIIAPIQIKSYAKWILVQLGVGLHDQTWGQVKLELFWIVVKATHLASWTLYFAIVFPISQESIKLW